MGPVSSRAPMDIGLFYKPGAGAGAGAGAGPTLIHVSILDTPGLLFFSLFALFSKKDGYILICWSMHVVS